MPWRHNGDSPFSLYGADDQIRPNEILDARLVIAVAGTYESADRLQRARCAHVMLLPLFSRRVLVRLHVYGGLSGIYGTPSHPVVAAHVSHCRVRNNSDLPCALIRRLQ